MKAGLATPEQLRKARAEQRREKRREPRGKREAQDGSRTSGLRAPKRTRPVREREGRARQHPTGASAGKEPDVHALNLRIRDLLDRNAKNDRNADLAFSFMRENVVRRVYVTDEQRRMLAGGDLAIVGFRRRHHIVPARVADEIQALRPIVFVHRATLDDDVAATDAASADDPYRDFPIPDDLRW